MISAILKNINEIKKNIRITRCKSHRTIAIFVPESVAFLQCHELPRYEFEERRAHTGAGQVNFRHGANVQINVIHMSVKINENARLYF